MTDWPFDPTFFRRLETLKLQSRRRFVGQGPGQRRTPRKGSSLEFSDFRPYAPGDDLRYVDWNLYSRLERLMLKLSVEEQDLCVHLLIDTSASMAEGSAPKLAYALRTAAALAYVGLVNHERLALGLFKDTLYQVLKPRRGRRQIFPLLELLAGVRAEGQTDLGVALKQYAQHCQAPGLAIVISDLLDDERGYQQGLQSLLKAGFEIHLLHLLSEEELKPELDGDLRLVDSEGGSEIDVTIDQRAVGDYQRSFQRFCDEAAHFCRRHGVTYLRLSSAVPFEDFVFHRLRNSRVLQ